MNGQLSFLQRLYRGIFAKNFLEAEVLRQKLNHSHPLSYGSSHGGVLPHALPARSSFRHIKAERTFAIESHQYLFIVAGQ